jgi:hypothetical protein
MTRDEMAAVVRIGLALSGATYATEADLDAAVNSWLNTWVSNAGSPASLYQALIHILPATFKMAAGPPGPPGPSPTTGTIAGPIIVRLAL